MAGTSSPPTGDWAWHWISLPECQDGVADQHNGVAKVQNGFRDLIGRCLREVERVARAGKTDTLPPAFIVLNMCSPDSGISSDFSVLHDRAKWDPAGCVGNVAIDAGGRVSIKENVITDLLSDPDQPCLVVLVVPIDSYEKPIAMVREFVAEREGNATLAVVALYCLDIGESRLAPFGHAPVIPMARVHVDSQREASVIPLGGAKTLQVLYPWLYSEEAEGDEGYEHATDG